MLAVPIESPVTTPDVEPIDIVELEEDQRPPGTIFPYGVDEPTHNVPDPVIGPGVGLTVIVVDIAHPPVSV